MHLQSYIRLSADRTWIIARRRHYGRGSASGSLWHSAEHSWSRRLQCFGQTPAVFKQLEHWRWRWCWLLFTRHMSLSVTCWHWSVVAMTTGVYKRFIRAVWYHPHHGRRPDGRYSHSPAVNLFIIQLGYTQVRPCTYINLRRSYHARLCFFLLKLELTHRK